MHINLRQAGEYVGLPENIDGDFPHVEFTDGSGIYGSVVIQLCNPVIICGESRAMFLIQYESMSTGIMRYKMRVGVAEYVGHIQHDISAQQIAKESLFVFVDFVSSSITWNSVNHNFVSDIESLTFV